MSDVEGVRNLLGTGLVDLAADCSPRCIAMVVLFRISPVMTVLAFGFLLCFAIALNKAFSTIRPIFRERGKINAEVTGRLAESLGGVRVIKGYHAEEREEAVFAGGVRRLLDNVMQTLTATSVMSLSASLLMGVVGADHHVYGRAPDHGGHADHRRVLYLHAFPGIPGCAHRPDRRRSERRSPKPSPGWNARRKFCASGRKIRIRSAP